MPAHAAPARTSDSRESLPRQLVEFGVLLALAVILFRVCACEGYIISTGSMAPTLLGRHKWAHCPSCGFEFAVGVAEGRAPAVGVCPNCDRAHIDLRDLPVSEGDQLLVHKSAYAAAPPRRWDVAVFRNPERPTEAYVKRIVGLPGETLAVRDGDVWINGQVAVKPLAKQRGLRILVHDIAHLPPPTDPGWSPRWTAESGWQVARNGLALRAPALSEPATADYAWLTYHHWLRAGGEHRTSVHLPDAIQALDLTPPGAEILTFEPQSGRLQCRGVLPPAVCAALLEQHADPAYVAAVERLFQRSHWAPVTDDYAYNRSSGGAYGVRDFCLEVELECRHPEGEFRAELTDGDSVWGVTCDFFRRQVRLEQLGARPLRTATLAEPEWEAPIRLEFSNFDRHLLVAVNGRVLWQPVPIAVPAVRRPAPRHPVRIGGRRLDLRIRTLRLYRDVYYTPDSAHPSRAAYPLADRPGHREFFVLGDNSPVSVDSRSWTDKHVLTDRLLIGKPLLVHLPATSRRFSIFGQERQLRVPDPSRIRYIH